MNVLCYFFGVGATILVIVSSVSTISKDSLNHTAYNKCVRLAQIEYVKCNIDEKGFDKKVLECKEEFGIKD